ncbi:TIR domain-containing protein [Saccharopolyspora shandongensis]|uniref:TIR domain-containing protein n=1 Tax=Saccharopolyspora shandongensis TaxID=418495 RepID=UPI003435244C
MIDSSAGYDAFLSYSHADADVATAVRNGLTRLARPAFRRRAMRVFRDAESLSAGSLPKSIEHGLLDSRYFILLASPQSARSKWVRHEVGLWREHRSPETFLIAVVDGEVAWGDGDFDWSRTDALPPELSGWFDSEPLCVPLAIARRVDALSLRHTEFRSAVCKLAATVRDVPPDELDSEDIRLHRRRKVLTRSGVALLCVLTLVTAVLSVVATQQRDRAEDQARIALSRALGAEVSAQPNARLSAQLATTAYAVAPTPQAQGALMAALERNRHAVSFVRPPQKEVTKGFHPMIPPHSHVALLPDGSLLAFAAERDERISLWDTRQRRVVGELTQPQPGVQALEFTPDGRMLITHDGKAFRIWDVATWRLVRELPFESLSPVIAVSPDSTLLAAARGDGGIRLGPPRVWDLRTGTERLLNEAPHEITDPLVFTADSRRLMLGQVEETTNATFRSTDPRLLSVDVASGAWGPPEPFTISGTSTATGGGLLVTAIGKQVQLWDLASRTRIATADQPNGISKVAISADGSTVVVIDHANRVIALDRELGNPVQLTEETSMVQGLALSTSGDLVAVATINNGVSLLSSRADARSPHPSPAPSDREVNALVADSRRAVTAGADEVQVWDLAAGTVERTLPLITSPNTNRSWGLEVDAALDSTGTRLAVQANGRVGVWDVETGLEVQHFTGAFDVIYAGHGPTGVRFLAGDNAVLVDRDGGPEVIAVASGEVIGKIPVPDPLGFATDPAGRTVAVVEGATPGIIGIYRWDGRKLSRFAELRGGSLITDLTVDQSGTRIAFSDRDNRIFLRDIDGERATEMQLPEQAGPGPLTFGPDDATLIDGGTAIRLWEVSTGTQIGTWAVDSATNYVRPVLTGTGDLVVATTGGPRVWTVRPDRWLATLCATGAGELQDPQYLAGIEVPPACTSEPG